MWRTKQKSPAHFSQKMVFSYVQRFRVNMGSPTLDVRCYIAVESFKNQQKNLLQKYIYIYHRSFSHISSPEVPKLFPSTKKDIIVQTSRFSTANHFHYSYARWKTALTGCYQRSTLNWKGICYKSVSRPYFVWRTRLGNQCMLQSSIVSNKSREVCQSQNWRTTVTPWMAIKW